MIMANIEGLLKDGTFMHRKKYYYYIPEDMLEFDQLMSDPEVPVIERNYYEQYVEVLLQPSWRR
jgi:hypothetical protein